jgi:hypothetical protein
MSGTYRLKTSTLAIQKKDGKSDPIAIPSGAILTVADPHAHDDDSIVECKWGRMVVFVRAFDLRERGERIESAS